LLQNIAVLKRNASGVGAHARALCNAPNAMVSPRPHLQRCRLAISAQRKKEPGGGMRRGSRGSSSTRGAVRRSRGGARRSAARCRCVARGGRRVPQPAGIFPPCTGNGDGVRGGEVRS